MTLKDAGADALSALRSHLPDTCFADADPRYLEEPRGRYSGHAAALLRPRTVDHAATILRWANDHLIGVVPYGGGTGLVGGQTLGEGPLPVLLSLERMTTIRDVNTDDNVLVADAGAILADVHRAAEAEDRIFPLWLASEGTCRIGGNLATNAGGTQVIRYGNARDLCLGLEAVLADGSVWHGLKRLRKDNTGYDLRNLLIGSEGTLGIITAAALKLFARPRETATAFVAVSSPAHALQLLNRLRDALGEMISAFELIHRQGIDFLAETGLPARAPFAELPEWSVLIDTGGGEGSDLAGRLERALDQAIEDDVITDAMIAQNTAHQDAFWAVRETIPEANRRIGSISSHDISVPVSRIPEFIEKGAPLLARLAPDLRINAFGHMGDGNLHYNVFPAAGKSRADYEDQRAEVKRIVHDLTDALDGSISAEHGIGRLKVGDLERYGDPTKLAAMRAIKAALDPNGILNPGAVITQN